VQGAAAWYQRYGEWQSGFYLYLAISAYFQQDLLYIDTEMVKKSLRKEKRWVNPDKEGHYFTKM
jgi:hypothetical protein